MGGVYRIEVYRVGDVEVNRVYMIEGVQGGGVEVRGRMVTMSHLIIRRQNDVCM